MKTLVRFVMQLAAFSAVCDAIFAQVTMLPSERWHIPPRAQLLSPAVTTIERDFGTKELWYEQYNFR